MSRMGGLRMRSLATVSLAEMVPPSIASDPFVAALVPVFDAEFRLLVADTAKILIFQSLATQPHTVLDQLAWQFDVDFYEQTMTEAEKRTMLANAIYWHSIKGTPHAVERVVQIAFGDGAVEEWFEYDGEPFHFRVTSEGGKFPTDERYQDLLRMIGIVKRASAILETIGIGQSAQQSLVIGGFLHIGQHIILGSA